jgi:hypothetical protein
MNEHWIGGEMTESYDIKLPNPEPLLQIGMVLQLIAGRSE